MTARRDDVRAYMDGALAQGAWMTVNVYKLIRAPGTRSEDLALVIAYHLGAQFMAVVHQYCGLLGKRQAGYARPSSQVEWFSGMPCKSFIKTGQGLIYTWL